MQRLVTHHQAPNPAACRWVGPFKNDFVCDTCVLGYETDYEAGRTGAVGPGGTGTGTAMNSSGTNTTVCAKPSFRPHRGWPSSEDREWLSLRDTRGGRIEYIVSSSSSSSSSRTGAGGNGSEGAGADGVGTALLLTEHTYAVEAPALTPKEER